MMPPSTGLPVESSARPSPFASSNTGRDFEDSTASAAGMSSEEPTLAEIPEADPYEPPPDRGHPVMVGEGERSTHA